MQETKSYYFDYVVARIKHEELPIWNQIEVGRFIRKIYFRLNDLLTREDTRSNVIKQLNLKSDKQGKYKIPDPVLNAEGGGTFYKIYTRRTKEGTTYSRNVFALYYGFDSYEDLIVKEDLDKGNHFLDVQIILNGNRMTFSEREQFLFKQVISSFLGISLNDVHLLEVINCN